METSALVLRRHVRETVRGLERELLEDLHIGLLATRRRLRRLVDRKASGIRGGAVQRAGMTVAATVDPESPGVDAGRLGRGVKPIRVGRRSIGTSSRASVCAS